MRRRLTAGRLGYSQERKGGVIVVSREDLARYYQSTRARPGRIPRRPEG
ncbi:hypothetical protein [Streptomyces sp. 4N124]